MMRSAQKIGWFLTTVLLAQGCIYSDPHRPGGTMHAIEESLSQASQPDLSPKVAKNDPVALPPEIAAALLPSIPVGSERQGPIAEARYDVEAHEVVIQEFFLNLVQGTGYNVVMHPQAQSTQELIATYQSKKGTINLALKNVTIPEVLDIIEQLYDLEHQWISETTFIIRPAELRTRVFQIDYLNIIRNGSSNTSVNIGAGKSQPSANNSGAAGSNANNQDTTNNITNEISTYSDTKSFWIDIQKTLASMVGAPEPLEPQKSEVITKKTTVKGETKSSDGAKMKYQDEVTTKERPNPTENQNEPQKTPSPPDNGRWVKINPNSGTVVIRAMPSELRDVEEFIKVLQEGLNRQVILEAKIIEVELTDGFRSGINWGALSQPNNGQQTHTFTQAGGGPMLGPVNNLSVLPSELYGTNETLLKNSISPFGGIFSLGLNLQNFQAFIELLELQGKVQVLSSPRVATVNGQKAVIKMGDDEFFLTGVTTQTNTSNSGGPSSRDVIMQLGQFFSGIALDVTPQIGEDGFVTLHIHPMVSEVFDQKKSFVVNGMAQELPLANSAVRESDSIVRAQNGQVVAIGGMIKNKQQKNAAKTPILGDIPLLGDLFSHNVENNIKSELVILLRPTIVEGQQTWSDHIRSSSARIGQINQPKERFSLIKNLSTLR